VRYVTADAKPDAVIEKMEPYKVNGITIAYVANIAGGGFCLCGTDDELSLPVYLYTPDGTYEPQNPSYQYILWEIAEITNRLTKKVKEKDPSLQQYEVALESRASLWQDLITGRVPPLKVIAQGPQQMELELTTTWHQGAPFNNFCPMGDGGRSVVGCTATAMAQIMKYWEWPPSGNDNSSYIWDGDQSCGGDVGGGALGATYSDPYDWNNMPDDCTGGCSQMEQDALAELSYEIGVSIETDYGRCGSGAPMYYFVTRNNPLINNFLYDSDATYNSDYEPPLTDTETIIKEIQWLRPIEVGGCLVPNGAAHAWVIYGYNKAFDPPQFLMNLGGGGGSFWKTWDEIADRCHNYIVQIAPQNTARFVGNTTGGDGSPDNPHQDIEEAMQEAPNGATLIFKADSVNNFSANTLVIDRPLTLKGHNVTIQ